MRWLINKFIDLQMDSAKCDSGASITPALTAALGSDYRAGSGTVPKELHFKKDDEKVHRLILLQCNQFVSYYRFQVGSCTFCCPFDHQPPLCYSQLAGEKPAASRVTGKDVVILDDPIQLPFKDIVRKVPSFLSLSTLYLDDMGFSQKQHPADAKADEDRRKRKVCSSRGRCSLAHI